MPLGIGQGEPVEVNGASNLAQQRRTDNAGAGRQPPNEQDRIRYGVISAVNDNSFVKVRLLNEEGNATGNDIAGGVYLPLLNPLSQIHLLWGSLRKGLICRVYWRGKMEPDATSVVEVIADEEHNFLKKEPQSNELTVGPFRIFSGGMTP